MNAVVAPKSAISWQAAHPSTGYTERSAYYRIRRASEFEFEAYHVDAVWGSPQLIGHGETAADAKQACEDHYARALGAPITPKD